MSSKFFIVGVTLFVSSLAGCVTTSSFYHSAKEPKDEAPMGPVHQVHATWESRIMVTQDVVNQGSPLIGIAGRLYFFGHEVGHPVQATGGVVIDLYDANPANPDGKPKMIERWEVDPVTLQRLLKKDTIGWGYTMFLPWSTYRPDITKVQLQVRYTPEKGIPLFSSPSQLTLRTDAPPTLTQRTSVTGATPPPTAAGVLPGVPPAGAQQTAVKTK